MPPQAWGLLELRHERPGRAVELLRSAVALDPTLAPVLQWQCVKDAATQAGE